MKSGFAMMSWEEHVGAGSKMVVDDVEMFYLDRGEGHPVVFVHGWASSSFSWRNICSRLSEKFRTIALDLPGFGLSQRLKTGLHLPPLSEHLIKFLKQLGICKFSLVGHSMGGTISAYLAATKPDSVDKLVLINPSLFGTEQGRRPFIVELVRKKPIGNILSRFMVNKYFIRYTLRRVYVKRYLVDQHLVEGYYQSVKRAGTTLFDAMNIMREFDLNMVYLIKSPILFVLGHLDRWVPFQKNMELAEKVGARIHVVHDAGHMVLDEDADAVINVIWDFLKS